MLAGENDKCLSCHRRQCHSMASCDMCSKSAPEVSTTERGSLIQRRQNVSFELGSERCVGVDRAEKIRQNTSVKVNKLQCEAFMGQVSVCFVANNFAWLVPRETKAGEITQLGRGQIRQSLGQWATAPGTLSWRHDEPWHLVRSLSYVCNHINFFSLNNRDVNFIFSYTGHFSFLSVFPKCQSSIYCFIFYLNLP